MCKKAKKAEKKELFPEEIIEKIGRRVFDISKEGLPEECAFADFKMNFKEIEEVRKSERFKIWQERAKVAITGFLSKEILDAVRIQAKNSKTTDMIPRLSEMIDHVKRNGAVHKNYQKIAEQKLGEDNDPINLNIIIPKEEYNGTS